MSLSSSIRLSIVDDDENTRRALTDLVRTVPHLSLVSQYASAATAIERLPAEKPDVVLMDINMPDVNGVDAVRRLKPLLPATQFLMLTVYEDTDHIFAALAAGATGYLLKSTRRDELVKAIEQIVNGGSPMTSGIARKVVQSFNRPPAAPGLAETLSPREQAVLALLAKGCTYKEIAEELGVGAATVDTYIRRIYEKLQVHSRTEAVVKYLGGRG
jgi:DNA-binding NarL/FixJ family response regulator